MDELQIRVSAPASGVMLGKCLVVLVAGTGFGWLLARQAAESVARGKVLTKAAYVADFERYRASLLNHDSGIALYVPVCIALLAITFGLYELLGRGAAWVLRHPVVQSYWRQFTTEASEPPGR